MRFTPLVLATMVGAVACAGRNAVVRPNEADAKALESSKLSDLDVPELIIEKLEEIPASECTYRSGPGSVVITLYNGELLNGKIIDRSWDNNDPHQFQLGTPLVIEGLQKAVEDMCVNEVRKVTVPSRLAHGNKISGGGLIPAGAAIIYKIKLIGLKPPMYVNPDWKEGTSSVVAEKSAAPVASDAPKDEL
ncbi:FKBP-type peptidyl-prolyl cis-trans isomerase [Orbilia oligospora]|uniref:peptidylprolyl isomerase n=1 Tax=Orbilia oligospora TaxID=2813651 RepID=A0A7C8KGV5_ORBOL|nr:FKBP-type peptidyl-prolyl cis-trans isomerase [Orbilia oligospora]KAF3172162.1 FKBP-type peptidyl-prolyl cis-trans isomerase [Orbilia oligospora]KAF3239485.1 Peptidyl-prolyl cis-trans isomerase fkbp13, chloroplastic [Orbilia oligospora]KAF3243949.1 Peptidyl-prolyl cis-trans isomerase fkbp13, chloroplastic [Orbilia oligospora]KAF3287977.1 FKBP-type peptidyl-prolyl cis-trans isomerase [Orbilia oligospora]